MVLHQLQSRGISDPSVLNAMQAIPRHRFVPEDEQVYAYEDRPISIGNGQTISQPFIVAQMTQLLGITQEDRVLEIGTGSGYQTAVLAELSLAVYTVERIEILQRKAHDVLKDLQFKNIYCLVGDGSLGWSEYAPYDKILVSAAAPRVPRALFEQLAVGGRLVLPMGGRIVQELTLVLKKAGGAMQHMSRGACVFVPLIGRDAWRSN